jgi:hypothetical protein
MREQCNKKGVLKIKNAIVSIFQGASDAAHLDVGELIG